MPQKVSDGSRKNYSTFEKKKPKDFLRNKCVDKHLK